MAKARTAASRKTMKQVCFRVPAEWLDRADAIAEKIVRKDETPATRTDSLRIAILRGLRDLEREHSITVRSES